MVLLHRTVLYNNVLLHRIIFKMRGVLFNKICFIAQNLKDQFCGGSACSNWRSMHNMNNSAVQSRCCASRRVIQGVVQYRGEYVELWSSASKHGRIAVTIDRPRSQIGIGQSLHTPLIFTKISPLQNASALFTQ